MANRAQTQRNLNYTCTMTTVMQKIGRFLLFFALIGGIWDYLSRVVLPEELVTVFLILVLLYGASSIRAWVGIFVSIQELLDTFGRWLAGS